MTRKKDNKANLSVSDSELSSECPQPNFAFIPIYLCAETGERFVTCIGITYGGVSANGFYLLLYSNGVKTLSLQFLDESPRIYTS